MRTVPKNCSGGFISGTLGTLVLQVGGNTAVSLLTSIFITRLLGPEGKGLYVAITMAIAAVILIANLGMGQASIYFIGRGYATRDSIFALNTLIAVIVGVLSAILMIGALPWLRSSGVINMPRSMAIWFFVTIPVGLWFHFTGHILLAEQRVILYNLLRLLFQFLIIPFFLVFIFLFPTKLEAITYAYLLAAVVSALLNFLVLLPINWQKANVRLTLLRQATSYGVKVWLSVLLKFVDLRLDIFIVSAFVGNAAVGFYTTSVTLINIIDRFPNAIASVLLPRVASKVDKADAKFTAFVTRTVLALSFILGLSIALFSRTLIIFLFGIEFLPAVAPIWLLFPGTIAFGVYRVLTSDLMGRGYPETSMYTSAVSAALTIILDLMLIPIMGINGAALASTISYTVSALIIVAMFTRLTGIHSNKILIIQFEDVPIYWSTIKAVSALAGSNYLKLRLRLK